MKNVTLKAVAGIAKLAVSAGQNTMCLGFLYQPKMPDQLKKTEK